MNKKRIVIYVNNHISHYWAIYDFTKDIAEKYELIYVGFEESRILLEKSGVDFLILQSCTFQELISKKGTDRIKYRNMLNKISDECRQILEEHDIDAVLFHVSRFYLFFESAYQCEKKIFLYTTNCGQYFFNTKFPPNTSSYIPDLRLRSQIIVVIHWLRRILRLELSKRTYSGLKYTISLLKKSYKMTSKLKYGLDGLYIEYPTLILGSGEFEYLDLQNLNSNVNIYTGLKKINRKGYVSRLNFDNKKVIYCTFGTLSHRYLKLQSFFVKFFQIVQKHLDWDIIVSLGEKGKEIGYDKIPTNVYIYDFINPEEVMPLADVVICHAGYGTIKDCIIYEVPILALPCSYDQHGNAARVEALSIGKRSTLLKRTIMERISKKAKSFDDIEKIETLLLELISNHNYKDNISALHERINYKKEREQAVNTFEDLLL